MWCWYSIEEDWDYAYVEISTDGGNTFFSIPGNVTTTSNPHGSNMGNGITGSSGGWVEGKFDLGDYAGQQIYLRLRYVTDSWWGSIGNEPPFVPGLDWRNLTQFRIGAEYRIDTKFGSVPLRIGFRNDPKPFKTRLDSSQVYLRTDLYVIGTDTIGVPTFLQSDYGVQNGSWINGNVFSFGTGIAWSQIKLDITYEYASYDDINKEVFTDLRPFDRGNKVLLDPISSHRFSKEESNKFSRIMISFTGYF